MYRVLMTTLILLACTPAAAGPVCQSLESAITEVKPLADKMHGQIIELTPSETTDYLRVLNAQPPETHLTADSLLIFFVPERGAVIGIVKDGCVFIAGRIGEPVHIRAISAARGNPA